MGPSVLSLFVPCSPPFPPFSPFSPARGETSRAGVGSDGCSALRPAWRSWRDWPGLAEREGRAGRSAIAVLLFAPGNAARQNPPPLPPVLPGLLSCPADRKRDFPSQHERWDPFTFYPISHFDAQRYDTRRSVRGGRSPTHPIVAQNRLMLGNLQHAHYDTRST